MKKAGKYIGIIISAILPVAILVCFTGMCDFNLYNWLWCGFYGSILIALFSKEKIYKYVVIIINLSIILFCAFGALMGGIYGLWIILLHMLIPFYSVILTLII